MPSPRPKRWFSTEIKQCIHNRDIQKQNGNYIEYKYLRNKVVNLIKAAKQKYFTSVIENAKGNTKIMWNCIRELTGNCSISNKVNMLIIE